MAQFDLKHHALVGTGGLLSVRADDEITRKLAMLIEGECEGLGPLQAAKKFGFSKQRYFQLRAAFAEQGALALQSRKRGPSHPELYGITIGRSVRPEDQPRQNAGGQTQTGWIR